jgi:nicotinate-nucleotide pyrophosphorylase (carboxylating)
MQEDFIKMIREQDIRDIIFVSIREKKYIAQISAQGEGVLSGIEWLKKACKNLGIHLKKNKKSGATVRPEEVIVILTGSAKQLAAGEEELIGWISKASGIATAARNAKKAAGKDLKVVCGAWKKMPLPIKDLVRQAVADGGIQYRMADNPFLYLDKNYVKVLGGVGKTLQSVKSLKGRTLVIQVKGEGQNLLREAVLAAEGGADIIMIDTGRKEDIVKIDSGLRAKGLRDRVKIAFAGNIGISDLKDLKRLPVEIIDIGQAVVDAPLLDMRMDITAETGEKVGTRTF